MGLQGGVVITTVALKIENQFIFYPCTCLGSLRVDFILQSKNMHLRLINPFKLPLGVSVYVQSCLPHLGDSQ